MSEQAQYWVSTLLMICSARLSRPSHVSLWKCSSPPGGKLAWLMLNPHVMHQASTKETCACASRPLYVHALWKTLDLVRFAGAIQTYQDAGLKLLAAREPPPCLLQDMSCHTNLNPLYHSDLVLQIPLTRIHHARIAVRELPVYSAMH